jgi:hypothetical protein
MATRIAFDGWFDAHGLDVLEPIPRFRLLDSSGGSLGIVLILLARSLESSVAHAIGLEPSPSNDDEYSQRITRAVLRFGVHAIERKLEQGTLPPPPEGAGQAAEIVIGPDDLPLLAQLAGEKGCQYQATLGRDLYCLAASPSDKTVRLEIEGRAAAPTTRPLCHACGLPDTDYLCSNLSHAEVTGVASGSISSVKRALVGALCQVGRPEVSDPSKCCPSQNPCWERRVEQERANMPVSPPLQLLEAVDHLDMAWRLVFGRSRRLLHASSTADVAALMLECGTREEFESRISDLTDLFKRLIIDEELLPDDVKGIDKGHTLQRLKAVLIDRAEGSDVDVVETAIRTLQAANDIRVGQQHSAAQKKTQKAFDSLGIRYPVMDWGTTWASLRSQAAAAFLELAHVTRRLEVASSAADPSKPAT